MNKRHRLVVLLLAVSMVVLSFVASPAALAQTDEGCDTIAPPGASTTYFVGLGNAAYTRGRYAQAVLAYGCALERDNTYTPAYVRRGFALAAQGDQEAALADYEAALALDDTLVSAYNNRGLLYTTMGNFGLAITDFTLAITLDPAYAPAYNNRGVVHAAEGNFDLALADIEQAMALDPGYAAPHATQGAVYSALALASYRQFLELSGEGAFLPAGEPDTIINALQAGRESGNFSAWLAFLTPAAE